MTPRPEPIAGPLIAAIAGFDEQAVAEPASRDATDARPHRLADRDGPDEEDQDDHRPERRVHTGQRIREVRKREDGRRAAGDRPDETRDLGDGARTPAEDGRHDDEEQRERVERVHRSIVAQDPAERRLDI